jgi:TatA/E family protein of Tat protein translocase
VFGVGGSELVVILLIALLLFGPSKIPEVARWLGRLWREVTHLQQQVNETFSELRDEIDLNIDLPQQNPGAASPRPAIQPPEGLRQPQPPAALDTAEPGGRPRKRTARLPVPPHDDYLQAQPDTGPDAYLSPQTSPPPLPPSAASRQTEADYAAQASRPSAPAAAPGPPDEPADANQGAKQ